MKQRRGRHAGGIGSVLLCAIVAPGIANAAEKAGGGAPQGTIEELVVTAQKRAENVQDVPASISVLGGARIAAIHAIQLTDYATLAPGFQVDSGGAPGRTQLTLRGVSTGSGGSAAVGVYVDDAPVGSSSPFVQGNSFALDLMPYDVDRVEILRGPQGTLYGASTMGGLLKYVLKSPSLDQFQVQIGGDVAGIEGAGRIEAGARLAANVPLVEGKLSVRFSLYDESTPGYIDNALTGRKDENGLDQKGGRVSLLWAPADGTTVKLSAMLQDQNSKGVAAEAVDGQTLKPLFGDLTSSHIAAQPFRQTLDFYDATISHQMDWATLSSTTSYLGKNSKFVDDLTQNFGPLIPVFTAGAVAAGQTPVSTRLSIEKVTQEIRLTSPSHRTFEWLAGLFYTDEVGRDLETLHGLDLQGAAIPGLEPFAVFNEYSRYREFAVFGDATYRLNDAWDVTGGLRWARNWQTNRQDSFGPLVTPSSGGARSSQQVVTYMASTRYHFSKDAMAYLRIASGYRPGGPNLPFPGVPPTISADRLVNYEAGLKSEFLDRKLLVDAAVFYIDWKDIQINAVTAGGFNYITNGGKAKSQGFELQSTLVAAPGLTLGGTLAFTDAKLTDNAPSIGGRSGDRLPLTPEWSGSLTADYRHAIRGDWTGAIGADYRYAGARTSLVASNPDSVRLPSYGVFGLTAELTNGRYTARLFLKNLTDERALLSTNSARGAAALAVSILQPRTFGFSLDAAF